MNFTKIFVIESHRSELVKLQEGIDEQLQKNVNKCPLIIASFLLEQRRQVRAKSSSLEGSFGSRLSQSLEMIEKWTEKETDTLEKMKEKGVCRVLGEIEIERMCKRN